MRSLLALLEQLDADCASVSLDVWLSCVAVIHAPDFSAAAREAPDDVPMDALFQCAWWFGKRVEVDFQPRGEATPSHAQE